MSETEVNSKAEITVKKRPLPLWRRIVLAIVLLAIAGLVVLMLAGYWMERRLGAEITKISEAGEPLRFSDLCEQPAIANSREDAAVHYMMVFSRIPPKDFEGLSRVNTFYRINLLSLPASQFPSEVREQIKQSLSTLRPALESMDKAAQLHLSGFDIGLEAGLEVCKERLQSVRAAAYLLSLRTLDLVLQGDGDAAANSVISMLKLMRVFDGYPITVVYRTKAAGMVLACHDIRLLLEYSHPSDESLARIRKVLSETFGSDALLRMLLAERIYQIEYVRNFIPEGVASRLLQNPPIVLPERLSVPGLTWRRLKIRRNAVRALRDMAWLIAASRRPWPEPLDAVFGSGEEPPKRSSRLLSKVSPFVQLSGGTLGAVHCTLLAVAVERYHRRHGRPPDSLEEIVPAHLDSIPPDPFTGGDLLYKIDSEAYVVYSVGVNRVDDGGQVTTSTDGRVAIDLGLRIPHRKEK